MSYVIWEPQLMELAGLQHSRKGGRGVTYIFPLNVSQLVHVLFFFFFYFFKNIF